MRFSFQILFTATLAILLLSCNDKENSQNNAETVYHKISKDGNPLENEHFPAIIDAEELHALQDANILMLDLRKTKHFQNGHIKGVQRVNSSELFDYIENQDISRYDKVVLICNAGQTASYLSGLLQLIGYDNVYSLKWGMSSWNEATAGSWMNNISDDYEHLLVKDNFPTPTSGQWPDLEFGNESPQDTLKFLARRLFDEGFGAASVVIDTIADKTDDYFIVSYFPEETYNRGHLPGAIRYKPGTSLTLDTDLLTLPTNMPIVVYCCNGQRSGFITAYLRMLGYEAYSLKFGENAQIHSQLTEENRPSCAFSNALIKNYELEGVGKVKSAE